MSERTTKRKEKQEKKLKRETMAEVMMHLVKLLKTKPESPFLVNSKSVF